MTTPTPNNESNQNPSPQEQHTSAGRDAITVGRDLNRNTTVNFWIPIVLLIALGGIALAMTMGQSSGDNTQESLQPSTNSTEKQVNSP